MIFFVLILLMILISTAKVAGANEYMDYMAPQNTNVIKGIFVIMVLFSHASQYIKLEGIYDQPYMQLQEHLHQMVVSMFFFYSGFGMMKSILKKKFDYIRTIPLKRFLVVFINFDIAVLLFVVLYLCMGTTFEIPVILQSLIGWQSVGNSNWYMFAIFGLYLLMFVSYYILRWFDNKVVYYIATAIFTVLTMGFVLWEIRMGQPSWWYNTMILLPFGCWYALLQEKIEKVVLKNDYIYAIVCALIVFAYCITFQHRWSYGIEGYTLYAMAFTLVVVLFTMKISFQSKLMQWFGEHVFSVYILQRIPMIILSKMGLGATNKYMFLVLSILFTIVIAMIFDYFVGKLNKRITKRIR